MCIFFKNMRDDISFHGQCHGINSRKGEARYGCVWYWLVTYGAERVERVEEEGFTAVGGRKDQVGRDVVLSNQSINQWINQSVHQSNNPSIHQSINYSINNI